MKPDDLLGLLPPLRVTRATSFVKLTEEEFDAALKGEVPVSKSALSLPEIAATVVAVASGEAPPVPEAERAAPAGMSEERLSGYTQAAALRYTYLLDALTPVPSSPDAAPAPIYEQLRSEEREAVFVHLTSRSEVVSDARGKVRWMLRDDERRAALRELIERGRLAMAVELARKDAVTEAKRAAEEAQQDGGSSEAAPPEEAGVTVAEPLAAGRMEETLWSYLTGQPPSLEETSERRQLAIIQRVVGWLYDLSPILSVPSPKEVSRQLARETLLQPFRHLTGEWKDGVFTSSFTGREEELSKLYDYLSVLPPASLARHARQFWGALLDSAWRLVTRNTGHRPLLIYGLGGVGKSSLLAKFLLDHLTETRSQDRFPYAYLDFDLSSLSAREPLTLLAEAARQLAAQYPSSAGQWSAVRAEWLEKSRLATPDNLDPTVRLNALTRFVNLLSNSEIAGKRVRDQLDRGLPFLLVLDTFEELQYHDRDAVKDVLRFLNVFREHAPTLRVIMMGRAPLTDVQREFDVIEAAAVESDSFGTGAATDFNVIEVPLSDLDEDDARAYLERQGIGAELAEELVEVVGGSPLSLRLIVRVFKSGGLDVKSLREETEWRPGVSDWLRGRKVPPKALLQGVLFDRILGHIHTQKVKDLAHPGLVLRRVTPELIKEVLAEPCGLGEVDDAKARWYYDQLAKEVSLVGTDRDPEGEDAIRHRPELRRIMLRLMSADEKKQEQIRQVHENAVRYYETRTGRTAREEALYHRLMLETPPRNETLLDDVPTEEAVESGYAPAPKAEADLRAIWHALAESVDELPLTGGGYLAARVRQELLPDAAWQKVNLQDWELMILGRASRRARERDNVISALEGLRRERKMTSIGNEKLSPLSPLFLIEVAFLERLGRYDEGMSCAESAVARLHTGAHELRRVAEYRLLGARIAARMKRSLECETCLKEAEAVSNSPGMAELGGDIRRRIERQRLRFLADCFNLLPSGRFLERLENCLLRLLQEPEGLKAHPALTRYAVASATAKRAGEEVVAFAQNDEFLEALWHLPLLSVLLDRLPSGTASRLAVVLAQWTQEAVASGVDPGQLQELETIPAASGDMARLHESWRMQLLDNPGRLAVLLAKFFEVAPLSRSRVIDLCERLSTISSSETDREDSFEEARRAGDLIPGEGRSVADIQAPRKGR